MAGSYEFWLTDDNGRRLADATGATLFDRILQGTFQRIANGVARFSARFPASFDTTLLKPDYMLQVWRAPPGGRLNLWRVYFIRWWRFAREGSDLVIEMSGDDPNSLLDRRIVANYTQTTGSEKTDYVDDMMKTIVDEQCVTDSSDPAASYGTRAIPNLGVQADASLGPSLSKAFSWQNVLKVISDLQRASWGDGTEVFWDIDVVSVSNTSVLFEFQTRTGQPGADRSGSVVFEETRGNLQAASLTYDWTQDRNYIYAGGQGEDEFRIISQAWNADRIALSQYARSEAFQYARYSSSPDSVESAALEALMQNRPQRLFQGQAVDTRGTTFGIDWDWGDRVTARFLDQEFEAIIRQVVLTIDQTGREMIDARIESVDWEL